MCITLTRWPQCISCETKRLVCFIHSHTYDFYKILTFQKFLHTGKSTTTKVLKFLNFFLKISIMTFFCRNSILLRTFCLFRIKFSNINSEFFKVFSQVFFVRFSERNTDFEYENYYPKIIFEIM
jgi:hypothetical protein